MEDPRRLAKIVFLRLASSMEAKLDRFLQGLDVRARRVVRELGAWLASTIACVCIMVAILGCARALPPQPTLDMGSMVATLFPGQSRATFSGCLGNGGQKTERALPSVERQPDEVRIRILPGGAVVTHVLAHPCCLEGNVRLSTRGSVATVHERLGGEPCRCECQSTIETAIGLDVGMWTVRVELEKPIDDVQVVDERRVKILEPRAEIAR